MEAAQKELGTNYEKSVERLQKIVKALEAGELSLEQSLAEFETGVKLIRDLQSHLKTAEQKIEILTKADGDVNAALKPFSP